MESEKHSDLEDEDKYDHEPEEEDDGDDNDDLNQKKIIKFKGN